MKKFMALLLSAAITISGITAFAATPANVKIGNETVQGAYIDDNGRTIIPALLSAVSPIRSAFNEQLNKITYVTTEAVASLVIGKKEITVNGVTKTMDTAPVLTGAVPFAPVRFITEAFGGKVAWDGKTRSVTVTGLPANTNTNTEIILATTTSTNDSGLLGYLLPYFTADTGYNVSVVSVGTGKAIQMGVDGEADVLLVHAKASELEFLKNGNGLSRKDVMYNDYILVGSPDDPAKVAEKAPANIDEAFKLINASKSAFISRGDDSGTDKLEKALWKGLGITPDASYYMSAGQGMGAVLTMTNEKEGYTITDRATYLSMQDKLDLVILCEGDSKLYNQYGVLPVNPANIKESERINVVGGIDFANWMVSARAQKLIGEFGVEQYGKPLFFPNAK